MLLSLLFFLWLVPAGAHDAADARFFAFSALPAEKKDELGATAAIHLLESSDGRCTAVTVSRRGHLLTARHCVQGCLIRQGVFQPVFTDGSISHFLLRRDKLGLATCSAQLDGQETELLVEATSPGLISAMDEASFRTRYPERMKDLEAAGFTARGDFVLLRRKDALSGSGCAALALDPVLAGVSVHSLGYPGATFRGDGRDSNGTDLYFTAGRVTAGIAENSCLAAGLAPGEKLADLQSRFDEPSAFLSTLDAVGGSSGSPVFVTGGKVVGILTNVYRRRHASATEEPEGRYCAGSAKALRIERVLALAKEAGFPVEELRCD